MSFSAPLQCCKEGGGGGRDKRAPRGDNCLGGAGGGGDSGVAQGFPAGQRPRRAPCQGCGGTEPAGAVATLPLPPCHAKGVPGGIVPLGGTPGCWAVPAPAVEMPVGMGWDGDGSRLVSQGKCPPRSGAGAGRLWHVSARLARRDPGPPGAALAPRGSGLRCQGLCPPGAKPTPGDTPLTCHQRRAGLRGQPWSRRGRGLSSRTRGGRGGVGVSGPAPWLCVPITVHKHRHPRAGAVYEVLVAFWSPSPASSTAGRRKSRERRAG
ncbi:protein tfg-1-like [Serinus canaria]|uniref:protein tfg-1-like n=1 Tax=Serinus canaria TaxID=9135 RepID=UPI0021CC69E8|nr:protein tfg-1-like [Serinus canaria]